MARTRVSFPASPDRIKGSGNASRIGASRRPGPAFLSPAGTYPVRRSPHFPSRRTAIHRRAASGVSHQRFLSHPRPMLLPTVNTSNPVRTSTGSHEVRSSSSPARARRDALDTRWWRQGEGPASGARRPLFSRSSPVRAPAACRAITRGQPAGQLYGRHRSDRLARTHKKDRDMPPAQSSVRICPARAESTPLTKAPLFFVEYLLANSTASFSTTAVGVDS